MNSKMIKAAAAAGLIVITCCLPTGCEKAKPAAETEPQAKQEETKQKMAEGAVYEKRELEVSPDIPENDTEEREITQKAQTVTGSQTTSRPGVTTYYKQSGNMTEESVIESVKQLMTDYFTYRGVDYEAFKKLYCNTSDDVIRKDFSSAESDGRLHKESSFILLAVADNHIAVDANYYTVTGKDPNTHHDADHYLLKLSFTQGKWKLDCSGETNRLLNEQLYGRQLVCPKEYTDAMNAGRNAAIMDNYMFVDPAAVYKGCFTADLKHAWQDEYGNVYISVWIANGTDRAQYVSTLDCMLADRALGEIINITGEPVNITVESMRSALYFYQIPADWVETGTQSWGNLYSEVNCTYN